MSDEIPDPWRSACERKGISPTYRPLAAAAGLSHETVRKVVQGRTTSKASIAKIATALGVAVDQVHVWRGEAPPDYGREFVPDAASLLLTTEEREAVNGIIRLLARSRATKGGGGDATRDTASNKPAGVSPAHVTGDDEGPVEPAKQDEDSTALAPVEQLHPTAPAEVELPQAARRFPPGGSKKQQLAAVQDGAEESQR